MTLLAVLVAALSIGDVQAEGGRGIVSLSRQPGPLVIRVLDSIARTPLPNAEILDLDATIPRFTNGQGELHLTWPAAGRLRVRVRQLGYRFVERTLTRRADGDTIVFALVRVAYTLPAVSTRASNRCGVGTDSISRTLSVAVLEQLRAGAERYETFRRAYPFRVRQERRTVLFDRAGKPEQTRLSSEQVESSRWGDRYDPRTIVIRQGDGFSAAILFIANLADAEFWRNHCFEVLGAESLHGERVLRLEFSPAPGVRGVEWSGFAFVDSATSILRRVEFSLTGLSPAELPRRYEGYTTFRSPSPFIAVPESTAAMWWRRDVPADGAWGRPDVVQLIRVIDLTYHRAKPPSDTSGTGRE